MKTLSRIDNSFLLGAILVLALIRPAFCIGQRFSQETFQKLGANSMIGEIVNVQITSTSPGYEVGTVEIRPIHVLSGTISVPTLVLPFQRTLALSDSAANWDNVAPLRASLASVVGEHLLIYFIEENGVYALFPAGNAVQNIKQGVVLAKIASVQHETSPDWRQHPVEVTLEVSETIFGWVPDKVITIPLSTSRLDSNNAAPSNDRVSQPNGHDIDVGIDSAHLADFCLKNQQKQVVVFFYNGKITGLQAADRTILQEIKVLDSIAGS